MIQNSSDTATGQKLKYVGCVVLICPIIFPTVLLRRMRRRKYFFISSSGEKITYSGFLKLAARFANVLTVGACAGDRLAAVGKSEYGLALYAACVQAGFVYLPLNTAYTPQELNYFVENSGAKVLVCDVVKTDCLEPLAGAALF